MKFLELLSPVISEYPYVNCIGILGILSSAKSKGIIKELRPLFETLLANERYYSLKLINAILEKNEELKIQKG
jgi:predicted nucleic acid-binding protein